MPTVDFGRMEADATLEELLEAFAKVQKMLDYLMQGGLDSKNAREFGGWIVGNTRLETKKDEYPRIVFDSKDLEVTAYQTADSYFQIAPNAYGSTPGIEMRSSLASALIYLLSTSMTLITAAGQAEIQVSSGKNLDLFCNTTSGYHTRFDSWAAMLNVDSGRNLQQEVDQITENMIDINSLFAYCNSLDLRITALGG